VRISENPYSVWTVDVIMKGIGSVRMVISEGVNGWRYYATSRKRWNGGKILETCLRRFDIKVMHRDLKSDGLGSILLRKLGMIELYLGLMVTGRKFLEIASIRSLSGYADIPYRAEKRKKWIG
jgi:hypothetical protein